MQGTGESTFLRLLLSSAESPVNVLHARGLVCVPHLNTQGFPSPGCVHLRVEGPADQRRKDMGEIEGYS